MKWILILIPALFFTSCARLDEAVAQVETSKVSYDAGYAVGYPKGYYEGFQAANTTAYSAGYASGYYDRLAEILKPTEPPEVISLEEALAIMARSRYTHQWYIDRPDEMQKRAEMLGATFDEQLKFQTAIVKRYDAVIDVLQRLK